MPLKSSLQDKHLKNLLYRKLAVSGLMPHLCQYSTMLALLENGQLYLKDMVM